MQNEDHLVSYYRQRAEEYEEIYIKPEHQQDLAIATGILQQLFKGRVVLEIACGTGYWTERIVQTAASIFATYVNKSVIDIARNKRFGNSDRVSFEVADMYALPDSPKYSSLFAGFILSHISRPNVAAFLQKLNSLTVNGGKVVLMDNVYVEGSSLPVEETDKNGNTFQIRKLKDGSEHHILKNFFSEEELKKDLTTLGQDLAIYYLKYFWIASYTHL